MNSTIVRNLLVRGMLAGVAAGLLAYALGYFVGEIPLREALVYESAHSTGREMEMVSRTLQETLGMLTAVLMFSTALGGLASLAFCFALGRLGRVGPRATAGLVALGAFVTVFLVPFLKYPANPPAVSDPDTLNQRTIEYVAVLVLSVLLGVAAVMLGKRLAPRLGNWNASILAAVTFVVTVGLTMLFMPPVNEMPKGFPPNVVWQFRVAAAGMQALLWASFGLLFGYLAERVLLPVANRASRPAVAGRAVAG